MFLFIRRVGALLSEEPPEDGFYFVIHRQCYKLTGDFIDNVYKAFMQGPTAFNKYRKTLKTIAPAYNCGAYYATRIWGCINKVFMSEYYEDIGNANWFIEMISKSPVVGLQQTDIVVSYPTGCKDGNNNSLYENDLVTDSEGHLWKIEITPSWNVCLKEVSSGYTKTLTPEMTSSLMRKES